MSGYRKACGCPPGTTATTGRMIVTSADPRSTAVATRIVQHFGPVCDRCDTPWSPAPTDPTPETGDEDG